MELRWIITDSDIAHVKKLVGEKANNPLVRDRHLNLKQSESQITKARFWHAMVSTRLTSQQRSGPDSYVSRFIRLRPFPLSYDNVVATRDVKSHIVDALRSRGIRFIDNIAKELAENFHKLEQGEWNSALAKCNQLTSLVSSEIERAIARYIANTFKGFGPKQSRNLVQSLHLTRYEIPIDSRVIDWLNRLPFPLKLTAAALADAAYYEFISDGIQTLCEKADVFPCILDASVFALKDGDGWTEDLVKTISFD